ncbi:hypothetical protein IF1G_06612 [Cordyceps javanica]|uniref:Uncharacterized protein n=1 Tax=Cordyceps javanica TaxID=43265 RepID=A0A545VXP4_9HYPO|nr:hypothetical protein IF1G_06612 [Cordyceps javanica]TQW06474.1 hypothetical protein IF2G_05896 [Cordyceps javanica]
MGILVHDNGRTQNAPSFLVLFSFSSSCCTLFPATLLLLLLLIGQDYCWARATAHGRGGWERGVSLPPFLFLYRQVHFGSFLFASSPL